MDALYFIPRPDFREIETAFLKDDTVSRQSLTFRTAANYGIKDDGMLIRVSGSEDGLEKAKEIIGGKGKPVEGAEKERILKQISEEEDAVSQGFGAIFE